MNGRKRLLLSNFFLVGWLLHRLAACVIGFLSLPKSANEKFHEFGLDIYLHMNEFLPLTVARNCKLIFFQLPFCKVCIGFNNSGPLLFNLRKPINAELGTLFSRFSLSWRFCFSQVQWHLLLLPLWLALSYTLTTPIRKLGALKKTLS